MDVKLLAHTQVSEEFVRNMANKSTSLYLGYLEGEITDGKAVALSAIRTCYSPNKPSEIVDIEGGKYFGRKATDGEKGTEADRLIRHIIKSGHTSTLEHVTFTFSIEGVSRALLAQLTRHRVGFSYSVQSQRYVRFGSEDKSGGFDYVVPDSVKNKSELAKEIFEDAMHEIQTIYDNLRACGIPAEDARSVLPNAACTNLVLTVNLRALLDFYAKRKPGNGAQAEIATLAERLKDEVVAVEPWVSQFFAV